MSGGFEQAAMDRMIEDGEKFLILSIMVGIFSSNKAEPMLHPDLYSGMHNTAYA